MNTKIILIECLTNLHVGNGEVNYNIIDKEVQKDVVTMFPTINSSSVKGAFRSWFEKNKKSEEDITNFFGSKNEDDKSQEGNIIFLNGDLVAIPQAAEDGNLPFKMVIPEESQKNLKSKLEIFHIKWDDICSKVKNIDTDVKIKTDCIKAEDLDLPILARNHLDNGISKNLWYEEVVPYKTIFAIPIASMDGDLLTQFCDNIRDKIVQFGGNASIGYGLCKICEIVGESNDKKSKKRDR